MNPKPYTSSPLFTDSVGFGLIALTLCSYFIAEGRFAYMTPMLLLTAVFKALLVGAVFMELKHTPWIFLAGFVLFFIALGGALYLCF